MIFILLLIAFVMRVFLYPYLTYTLDHNTFIAWGRIASDVGFNNFYTSTWSDYLPGYIYVLGLLAKVEKLEIVPVELLFKLPAIIGDLLTGGLIYLIVKRNYKKSLALFASFIFLFNPAVFANSTLWGQVDVFTSLFSLLSIYFLNSNFVLSAISLALGATIKPQIAMTLPIILALTYKKWSIKKTIIYFLIFTLVFLSVFIPFSSSTNNFQFILERINVTLNQYKFGSVNAFNFWGIFGFWKPDDQGFINPKLIGNLFVVFTSIFVYLKVHSKTQQKYLGLAILFLINFLFMTRMHERHMLPIFAPLAIATATNIYLMPIYLGFSITYLANLFYAYNYVSQNHSLVLPDIAIITIIVINILMFAYLLTNLIKRIDFFAFSKKVNKLKSLDFKDHLSIKQSTWIILLILVFSLFSRLFNLENPPGDYFDEIYHGFTAKTIANGDPGVWDWMVQNPPDKAYEWTHPPLAKEIMAGSILVFGERNFSARVPGALAGVGIVYLTYLIALALTKSRDISVISALLISIDGLVFTMSRIATADIYFVFFVLLSFYFYLKDKYLFSSIALGMSLATKWTTFWFLPLLLVTHISLRRKIFDYRLVMFAVIPVLVYLASYLPMFLFGYDFEHFIGMQKQMWWYHTGLKATHPYTSPWWSWPFMTRPVYLYQFDNKSLLGNIYAMGNPLVFYCGVVSILWGFYYAIKTRSKKISLILFAYLIFFVPWAASPRIMFIYHYLPSIPFMVILIAIALKKNEWLVAPIVLGSFLLFIYFYPHWTGIPIPESFSSSYYWIKSWR